VTNSWNERNRGVITEFRSAKDKADGSQTESLLLLSTTGAKSGLPRTNPLAFQREGTRLFVFASKGGAPASPDWYHNLVANPSVTVEVGSETFEADAVVLASEERDRIFAVQAASHPNFGEYQQKTTRKIAVVELVRKD
jgi:deazaflavin-dependent oxidoreductase (nitroreductase family)